MSELHGKSFIGNRKLSFLSAIELIKQNPGMAAERIIAKLQIELGYSEEKAQNMLKVLTIDNRIIIEDGKVFLNEIKD